MSEKQLLILTYWAQILTAITSIVAIVISIGALLKKDKEKERQVQTLISITRGLLERNRIDVMPYFDIEENPNGYLFSKLVLQGAPASGITFNADGQIAQVEFMQLGKSYNFHEIKSDDLNKLTITFNDVYGNCYQQTITRPFDEFNISKPVRNE